MKETKEYFVGHDNSENGDSNRFDWDEFREDVLKQHGLWDEENE